VLGKESTTATLRQLKKVNTEMLVMTGLMAQLEEQIRIKTIVALLSLSIMEGNRARLVVVEEEMEVRLKDLMFRNIQILTVFS